MNQNMKIGNDYTITIKEIENVMYFAQCDQVPNAFTEL